MFGFARGIAAAIRTSTATRCFATARCDEAEQADDGGFGDTGSFAESGRDDENRKGGGQFAQPMLFENLAGTLRQGSVNNYDGFRLVLQKQVNLNTITSHFYWIGSQSVPPIYQYRLILPFEDKQVNVATDMDFNIEGEVRVPLGKGLSAKTNFSVHEQQGNNLSVDVDLVDDSSATQVVYSPNGNVFTLSFMQSLNKYLILGGQGEYAGNKGALALSFGGVYDDKENVLGCQWDTALRVMFLKRINPNRVHLSADLVVDAENNSTMTVGAEYSLKQSKLHMSMDSNMLLKSYLETQVGGGVTLQFCAEMKQSAEHFRFGYGLQIM